MSQVKSTDRSITHSAEMCCINDLSDFMLKVNLRHLFLDLSSKSVDFYTAS